MRPPKHQILSFVRSETEPKNYKLVNSRFKGFVSVKIEDTYTPRLKEIGAKYIFTGFDQNGNKTIFTGLFPMGDGWFHGDHYTPDKAKKHRLIVIKPTPQGFILYYFQSYPKKKSHLLHLLK